MGCTASLHTNQVGQNLPAIEPLKTSGRLSPQEARESTNSHREDAHGKDAMFSADRRRTSRERLKVVGTAVQAAKRLSAGKLKGVQLSVSRDESIETDSCSSQDLLRVNANNAQVGLMVSLDLGCPNIVARFPGDTGPGILIEDHFGDGLCWRVRWVNSNSWGIYNTGLGNQFQLFIGRDKAEVQWDSDCFQARGRMPSLFFFAAPPSDAHVRQELVQYSSPRSRILAGEQIF